MSTRVQISRNKSGAGRWSPAGHLCRSRLPTPIFPTISFIFVATGNHRGLRRRRCAPIWVASGRPASRHLDLVLPTLVSVCKPSHGLMKLIIRIPKPQNSSSSTCMGVLVYRRAPQKGICAIICSFRLCYLRSHAEHVKFSTAQCADTGPNIRARLCVADRQHGLRPVTATHECQHHPPSLKLSGSARGH